MRRGKVWVCCCLPLPPTAHHCSPRPPASLQHQQFAGAAARLQLWGVAKLCGLLLVWRPLCLDAMDSAGQGGRAAHQSESRYGRTPQGAGGGYGAEGSAAVIGLASSPARTRIQWTHAHFVVTALKCSACYRYTDSPRSCSLLHVLHIHYLKKFKSSERGR